MKAALDTDEYSTALWVYLYASVLFVVGCLLSVRTGMIDAERERVKKLQEQSVAAQALVK